MKDVTLLRLARLSLKELADKVDATSDCDHKRASCAEIGCIGEQVKKARKTIELLNDRLKVRKESP